MLMTNNIKKKIALNRYKTKVKLGLLLGSILFSILIFEIILHLTTPQLTNVFSFYEYDKNLGWKNKKNISGTVIIPKNIGIESKTSFTTNSKGLRDKEYNYKRNNKKRILALGDSFTWGYGVNDNERYTEILEETLNIEVINAGVAGYGTDQEYLYLIKEGYKYNPDIIIVGFQVGSDIKNNIHEIEYGYPKPYFIISHDQLILKNTPVPKEDEWLKPKASYIKEDHKRVFNYFYKNLKTLKLLWDNFNTVRKNFRNDYDKNNSIEYPINISKKIITEIQEFSEKNNIKLIVVIMPNKEQIILDESHEIKKRYDKVNSEIKSLSNEGIEVIDLLQEFRKYNQELYLRNDGHWNEEGHKVAAQIIKSRLENSYLNNVYSLSSI